MKKNMNIFYCLFITLLGYLLLTSAYAGECRQVYYAKTLEGNQEVKLCTIGETLIYQFGKLNAQPDLLFSTLKKNVLYDQGTLDEEENIDLFSLYIPNGNTWYGLVTLGNDSDYNILTVNRGKDLNKTNYYEKAETLMSYSLDEKTIVNNLTLSDFTKIQDGDAKDPVLSTR